MINWQSAILDKGGTFQNGRFESRTSRDVRKTEESAFRSMIGKAWRRKTTEIDKEFQKFGRYMVDYMKVRDMKYIADI